LSNLFHFSSNGEIEVFEPRPPLRHPDSEPLVYGIDLWHSPLYLFPRDCPRIGVWPIDSTCDQDRRWFEETSRNRIVLFIDQRFEGSWRSEGIYRYEFRRDGFIDCQDHGVWVNRSTVYPVTCESLTDLPAECQLAGVEVRVVPNLAEKAREFFDYESKTFRTTLHVSMIRMSLLADKTITAGSPTLPRP
jgi:hypothetical protein